MTYNGSYYAPSNGQEYKSDGTLVNPADSVDGQGNQGVNLNGRKGNYQRVLANQALAANGSASIIINTGLGTKGIHLAGKCNGTASIQLYPCDANGNILLNTGPLFISSGSQQNPCVVVQEWGGAPYLGVYVADKSTVANTIQFVDVWWTIA